MLETYEKEKKIYSITGYNYPPKLMKIPKEYKYDIYFSPRAGSWGWATWKDRWDNADWEVKDYEEFKNNKQLQKEFNKGGDDMTNMLTNQMGGKLDSWAIRWCYTLFKKDAYCIYPVESYLKNIGLDGSGVHSGSDSKYVVNQLNFSLPTRYPEKLEEDSLILDSFQRVFKQKPFQKSLYRFLNKTFVYDLYLKLKKKK